MDDASFFVRQHYVDFLNREPDAAGLAFWTGQMTSCGSPNAETCRVNVSGSFFLSIEFQQTGYLVYKTYGAAFGTTRVGSTVPLTLAEFLPDVRRLGQNFVVGSGAGRRSWRRTRPSTSTSSSRAQVLRAVVEDSDFNASQSNRAFVLMEYFGYLRRNPNDAPSQLDFDGYNFWLSKLNQFGGNYVSAEMVKAFLQSGEYRKRFGQ